MLARVMSSFFAWPSCSLCLRNPYIKYQYIYRLEISNVEELARPAHTYCHPLSTMWLPYTSGFHTNEKLSLGFSVGSQTNDSVATGMDKGQSKNMALESTPHALICISSSRNDLGRLQAFRTKVGQLSCSCHVQVGTVRKHNCKLGRGFGRGLNHFASSEAGNFRERCFHDLMSVGTSGMDSGTEVAFEAGKSDRDEIVKLSEKDTLVNIWREWPLALRGGFVAG